MEELNIRRYKQFFGKNTKIGCDLVDDKLVYASCLVKRIAEWKKNLKSENQDYLTGYMSGLSVVEGMIADMPAIPAITVEWIEDMLKEWYKNKAPFEAIGAVSGMLVRWRKEQEAQDG